MANFSINTINGGLIELNLVNDRFSGQKLYLHVDQSANLNNGEGDCSIIMNNEEVKDLIAMLNGYLTFTEGITHIVLAGPLLDPSVVITVIDPNDYQALS